jgi:NAD(P)-dependent dehydrogenase (short-subunit alcohol dehydrogenase family)
MVDMPDSSQAVAMTTRTWLITGANSGFGRHLTTQLLSRGDRVAGTFRAAGSVDDLAADNFRPYHLDVTDPAGITSVVDRAFADLGRIDVVVSNAGYGLMGAAEELTDEQVEHQIAAAASCSCRRSAARRRGRADRSITPPSGAWRASPRRSPARWHRSASA